MSRSKNLDLLVPALSYTALRKALRAINIFIDLFHPFYNLSTSENEETITKLLFLEAAIYQSDEENEENCSNFNVVPESMIAARDVFNQLGLWDEEFETLLQKGISYWQLERQFCSGVDCIESKLREAMINKSFDIWMLHHLLVKLIGPTPCTELSNLLLTEHQFGEILDDLEDYNKDVNCNTFNSYRVFIYLYAEDAPYRLRQHLDSLEKTIEQQVQKLEQTRPDLAQKYLEQIEAWNQKHPIPAIPQPIWEFSKASFAQ